MTLEKTEWDWNELPGNLMEPCYELRNLRLYVAREMARWLLLQ